MWLNVSILVALAWLLVGVVPVYAQATTVRETVTEPLDLVLFNECTGEAVALTGELRITTKTTIDADGGTHATFHLVPQDVQGVGLESEIEYRGVGGARIHFNADADEVPSIFTATALFNLVTQGGSDNLQVKYRFHVTVNATGEVTAEVSDFIIRCVG
jgi:hypothetical protein